MIFYRGTYTSIIITLTASEALGLLDTDRIEDYNGDDGQLSLRKEGSALRVPILMAAVPSETPETDDDVFRGTTLLSMLEDGVYHVEGRIQDKHGNMSILSDHSGIFAGARVIPLSFEILDRVMLPHKTLIFRAELRNNSFSSFKKTTHFKASPIKNIFRSSI